MRFIINVLLVLSTSLSWSAEISLGEDSLIIPDPDGFASLSAEKALLYEAQERFKNPMNKRLITYIPNEMIARLGQDKVPKIARRFAVSSPIELREKTISSIEFRYIKNLIKTENEEKRANFKARRPELMEKIPAVTDRQIEKEQLSASVLIAPKSEYEETEHSLSFSYSIFLQYDKDNQQASYINFASLVTVTVVYINGKVLYFYSYAEEDGLSWSQQASAQWVNQVNNANPPDFTSKIIEFVPSRFINVGKNKLKELVLSFLLLLFVVIIIWLTKRIKSTS